MPLINPLGHGPFSTMGKFDRSFMTSLFIALRFRFYCILFNWLLGCWLVLFETGYNIFLSRAQSALQCTGSGRPASTGGA